MNIPSTREEAIAALVELDVAKWGEQERDASRRMHARRSYGLALNELANRELLSNRDDSSLRKAAKAAMTDDDRAFLRSGG